MVLHASARGFIEIAARMLEGMEAGWTQSIDKLEEHLAVSNAPEFTISRTFNAPREAVWRAYSELAALSEWWGPKGFEWIDGRLAFKPAGSFHYGMRSPTGEEMWGKFVYREIVKPERLAFLTSFSDRTGNTVRAPFAEDWPLEVLNVLTFTELHGATTVIMRGTPHNATEAEKKRFEAMKPSMSMGFNGTLDQLERYLAQR
jgi:uncharacterized protein YndB with AHSA1/START domain